MTIKEIYYFEIKSEFNSICQVNKINSYMYQH